VQGGTLVPFNYLLEAEDPTDLLRRRQLVESATEARHASMVELEEAQRAVTERLAQVVRASEDARNALRHAESEAAGQAAVTKRLAQEVEHRRRLVDLVSAAAPVPPSDIPRLFLDAYRQAAAALAKRSPGCRVEWAALAGIGKIESNHGRYRGARLALNGDVYPRIIGIPLDGTRSRLILDTDGGKLDGDTTYDRAVGPMQFIPSTWKRIEQDGNRDGVRDPNNAYDAALGAAAYLCRAVPAGGLDADEALRVAFFSYNRSEAYGATVLSWTNIYRQMAASGLP
ncbi:MAG TPA: hypothetical protein VFO65_11580, partial [Acidimicrobiales bacterium]|nr:hypothetical protein [Acidimicrobiales bacterium]